MRLLFAMGVSMRAWCLFPIVLAWHGVVAAASAPVPRALILPPPTGIHSVQESGSSTYLGATRLTMPNTYALTGADADRSQYLDVTARYFMAVAGVPGLELAPGRVETSGSVVVTHHTQTVGGVPIEGTYATAVVSGRDLRFARQLFVTPPDINTVPDVAAEVAAATAQAFMTGRAQRSQVLGAPKLVVSYWQDLPALTWRVAVRQTTPSADWNVYVDAHSGDVLGEIHASTDAVVGRVSAQVEPLCSRDPAEKLPMPFAQLAAGQFADAGGGFASAAGLASVQVSLTSPFINIINAGGAVAPAFPATLQAAPAVNDVQLASTTPLEQADAFFHFHHARNWVAAHTDLSAAQLAWAAFRVPVTVNEPDVCNAFFSPQDNSLHFFVAGSVAGLTCENTARFASVVMHEYGHGVQFNSGNGANFDGAVAEGYADIMAAFIMNDPAPVKSLSPRCATPQPGLSRTCVNNFSACTTGCTFNAQSEIHDAGQAICATWWELRQGLSARYDDQVGPALANYMYLTHLQAISGTMADTYQAAIAFDQDDDNNPANGTTHSCEINLAYNGRLPGKTPHFPQLAGMVPSTPSLHIGHTPPGVLPADQPLTLSATLKANANCAPGPIASPLLHYTVGGSADEKTVPLMTEGGDVYSATLSDVKPPAVVKYYITAQIGATRFIYPFQGTTPAPAAGAPLYRQTMFYGGVPSEKALFSSDFEADDAKLAASTDNADADSQWEWGAPILGFGGDPLKPHSGTKLWATNLVASSVNTYGIGRTSTLALPAVDASDYETVHLRFWRVLLSSNLARIEVNGQAVFENKVTSLWRDPVWTFQDIDITEQAAGNPNVQVRFVTQDAPSDAVKLGGWALDDVSVVGVPAGGRIIDGKVDGDPQLASYNFAGCGCQSGRAGDSLPWLAALCAALVWRRRRRTALL
jgi:MYXO-CTERM domain-containing protein